jgi:type IV secretory pathway VirB6-like protein
MSLIGLLVGWGVPQKLAKPLLIVIGVALLFGSVWLSLHLYRKHRYDEGVAATDAKWQAAVDQLKKDAAKSATKADDAAATRTADQIAKHTKDQEAVNEAQRNGTSPLDALFGN